MSEWLGEVVRGEDEQGSYRRVRILMDGQVVSASPKMRGRNKVFEDLYIRALKLTLDLARREIAAGRMTDQQYYLQLRGVPTNPLELLKKFSRAKP